MASWGWVYLRGGQHAGIEKQEPSVIAHQGGIASAQAAEEELFRDINRDQYRPVESALLHVIVVAGRETHPVVFPGVQGFHQARYGERNPLRWVRPERKEVQLRTYAQSHVLPGPLAHHHLHVHTLVVQHGVGLGPPALHQPGVLVEVGDEEGLPQGGIERRGFCFPNQHLGQVLPGAAKPVGILQLYIPGAPR